jgi:hypothetical protein
MRLLKRAESCHYAGQPLPAYFPDGRRLISALEAMFIHSEQGLSIHRLHTALASHAFDEAGIDARNVNTPEQWRAFSQND